MNTVEERIDPSMVFQTEFEELVNDGCKKAEELMGNSDKEDK